MPGLILPHSAAAMYRAAASGEVTDYANLDRWYDADDAATITDSGGTVTRWNDKSANGRDLTVVTGTPTTGTRTVNSKNAIDMVGGSEHFQTDWTDKPFGAITVIAVIQSDSAAGSYNAVSNSGTPNRTQVGNSYCNFGATTLTGTAAAQDVPIVICASAESGTDVTQKVKAGDQTEASGTVTRTWSDAGSTSSVYWFGNLDGAACELVTYSRVLTDTEKNAVANILKARWNATWTDI